MWSQAPPTPLAFITGGVECQRSGWSLVYCIDRFWYFGLYQIILIGLLMTMLAGRMIWCWVRSVLMLSLSCVLGACFVPLPSLFSFNRSFPLYQKKTTGGRGASASLLKHIVQLREEEKRKWCCRFVNRSLKFKWLFILMNAFVFLDFCSTMSLSFMVLMYYL